MYYIIVYLRSQVFVIETATEERKARDIEFYWKSKEDGFGKLAYKVVLTKKVD